MPGVAGTHAGNGWAGIAEAPTSCDLCEPARTCTDMIFPYLVPLQNWVNQRLTQQHAVCQVLDASGAASAVVKANQVADLQSSSEVG